MKLFKKSFSLFAIYLFISNCFAQTPGNVLNYSKFSSSPINLTSELYFEDFFGSTTRTIGDLDNDGFPEIAIGAPRSDAGGTDRGAVYILFLNSKREIKSYSTLSSLKGYFSATLDNSDNFGCSIASLGDFDKDGIPDIAVGACGDDDGGTDFGCIYIIFLKSDGTVKGYKKISKTADSGFTFSLTSKPLFGFAIDTIGDLNKDGIVDLLVGIPTYSAGSITKSSAAVVLFLNSNGLIKSHKLITNNTGGFGNNLKPADYFGFGVSSLDDINKDGNPEVVVGTPLDDVSAADNKGAVYILSLNSSGAVIATKMINSSTTNFSNVLNNEEMFGTSICSIPDINCDQINELIVGTPGNDGQMYTGRAFILFLNSSKEIDHYYEIGDKTGGFNDSLQSGAQFGYGLSFAGDLTGDNKPEILVAARRADQNGQPQTGDVWLLSLDAIVPLNPIILTLEKQDISCFGQNDGKINVQISGGMKPYTINWSSGDTGLYLENLSNKEYIVTITDKKGCKASSLADISEPS